MAEEPGNPTAAQPAGQDAEPPADERPVKHQQQQEQHQQAQWSGWEVMRGPEPEDDFAADSSRKVDSDPSSTGEPRSPLSESINHDSATYEFRYENGRRYHAMQDEAYLMPNDIKEMDRLELQHRLFRMTLGDSLTRAPLPKESLREVLDLGTGTGIWVTDFAKEHPDTHVIGVDLSPIQPEHAPENCDFYVADVEKDWTFAPASLDYVHSRMIISGIKNWPQLISRAMAGLRPNGWVEFQEVCFPFRCDDGTIDSESPVIKWSQLLFDGAAKIGARLNVGPDLPQMLRDAGFVDVRIEWYAWPLTPWPKDNRLKNLAAFAHRDLDESIEPASLGFLGKVLGWAREDIDKFLVLAREDMRDRRKHFYIPISVAYGRKPEPAS